MRADCIVIGGGISGLISTLLLHEVGLQVTLIERGDIGRESSWAGGGILSPLYPWRCPEPITALASWSQKHYPSFIDQLFQRSGVDPEYICNGLLVLDHEEYSQAQLWADLNQVKLEKLTRSSLHQCEPELAPEYHDAFWLPEVGQMRNPRLLKALKQTLLREGVPLLEQHSVQSIRIKHHKVEGIQTQSQDFIATGQVVVAAGAWSNYLLSTVHLNLPVSPVRGQMILLTPPSRLVSRIVLANDHYLIPRRDGHLLVGSTLEEVGFDKTITLGASKNLKQMASSLIPRLADYSIQKQWAGLRPSSPQGIPYICRHPDIEGLYLNTGHFRNGIVLGLASACLLVDIMLERPPIVDPSKYSIIRA